MLSFSTKPFNLKKYGHLAYNYWHMWITYYIETKISFTISVELYGKIQNIQCETLAL